MASTWVGDGWQTDEAVNMAARGSYKKQPHPEPEFLGTVRTRTTVFQALAHPPAAINYPAVHPSAPQSASEI